MPTYANKDTEFYTFKLDSTLKTTTANFKIVYLSGSMTVGLPTSSGAQKLICGVLNDENVKSTSEYARVIIRGLARINGVSGGTATALTITAGTLVACSTNTGEALPYTTYTANLMSIGQAFTNLGETGGSVLVNVQPQMLGPYTP